VHITAVSLTAKQQMMKDVVITFLRSAVSRARGAVVVSFSMLLAASSLGQSYVWKNVAIKGGGFVSGIITHPNAPGVVYCRTDIGGAYRWNATNNSWIPLLDFAADANIYGVESLAIDPSDSNRLYIAASRGNPPALLVSTNRGATFSTFTPLFSLNGNAEGRSAGERMAVDPNANNILFYGTRNSRLYRSVNYGTNWTQLAFPVTSTTNNVGLIFIEFIKESGAPGSATPTIFVGVSQGGTNLFRSTDAGVTWINVPTGAPANQMSHHAAQDGLGNMYVTFNDAPGPNGIGSGSVRKFNLTTLLSSTVTPPTGQGGFAGVSVSRQNPLLVAVSTMNRWGPAPPADLVYRSINGGTNWTATMSAQPSTASAPWSVARQSHWAGDVEIDPSNSNRAWFITGYGVIGCTNFTSAVPANWAFTSDGIEETVPLGLASPPSGPFLLSGHGDIGGFRHFNLDATPPLADYFNTHRGTSIGIDFAEDNPNRIVRLYSGAPHGAYSGNGGSTWQDFGNIPAEVSGDNRGNAAISADGSRIVWMPAGTTNGAYFSTNNGINWTLSTGGPTGTRFPFSDRVNSNKFYIYSSASGGRCYISTNGGATFTLGAAISGNGTSPRAVFGREGHIWLPRGNNGMSHSTNSGVSFTPVTSVQRVSYVGFGKAAVGQSYPTILISGRVGGVDGLYRSDNEGASWIRINDAQHQFGLSWVHVFCGDPRVFGRVYFGTEGRGIIYGQPAEQSPAAPTGLAASPGDGEATLTWTASSGATNYYVKQSLVSGNSYTVVATNAGVAFTNTGLSNGTIYYYVVSAVNAAGESTNSVEASARPFSMLPTEVGFAVANDQVQLAWPLDHTGWLLQVQTNTVAEGLGTNWITLTASDSTNQFTMPIDVVNGSAFFRLISP
jgi:hypothetical protein